MELSVYKIDGSESGKKVVLSEEIFGITPNDLAAILCLRCSLTLVSKILLHVEVDSVIVWRNAEDFLVEDNLLSGL